MPSFAQVVIGPPGSGKSTYCNGLQQFFNSIGRYSIIINLDLANDKLPYKCDFDLRDFITLEEIMEENSLGPNGGLIKAFETILEDSNLEEEILLKIIQIIKAKKNCYVIFDTPGQIELITNNFSLKKLFKNLQKKIDLRLCCINLIDSIYLTTPSLYISVLLNSLRSMLLFDLPQINVISKIDLLKNYDELPFKLNYYLEVENLTELIPFLKKEIDTTKIKFKNLNLLKISEVLIELIEDFKLVEFEVLSVEDTRSMINLIFKIDKANGYIFGTNEISGIDSVWMMALNNKNSLNLIDIYGEEIDIHERWIDHKDDYDKIFMDQQKKALELLKKRENNLNPQDEDDEYEEDLKKFMINNKI